MKDKLNRQEYVQSLDQLFTVCSILSGFAFSGLIAIPGMEPELFAKIANYLDGNTDIGFYGSFYALFFCTLFFLSSIMTILVYKASNYTIPIHKLRNVYLTVNVMFSLAIATLMVSVIIFAMPSWLGVFFAFVIGSSIAGSFLWENLLPSQRAKREKQLASESEVSE